MIKIVFFFERLFIVSAKRTYTPNLLVLCMLNLGKKDKINKNIFKFQILILIILMNLKNAIMIFFEKLKINYVNR